MRSKKLSKLCKNQELSIEVCPRHGTIPKTIVNVMFDGATYSLEELDQEGKRSEKSYIEVVKYVRVECEYRGVIKGVSVWEKKKVEETRVSRNVEEKEKKKKKKGDKVVRRIF